MKYKTNIFTGGIFQFTPLGKIHPELIAKKFSKNPIRLFIPTVPLPAIEIKYPLIQLGRLIVSISLALLFSWLIMHPVVQQTFQTQVIDRFLPKIELSLAKPSASDFDLKDINKWLADPEELFDNAGGQISEQVQKVEDYAQREIWRKFWFNVVVGGGWLGFGLRSLLFYVAIGVLYINNKNDWKSLEREFAKQKVDLAKIGENILDTIEPYLTLLYQNQAISKEQFERLQKACNSGNLQSEDLDLVLGIYKFSLTNELKSASVEQSVEQPIDIESLNRPVRRTQPAQTNQAAQSVSPQNPSQNPTNLQR